MSAPLVLHKARARAMRMFFAGALLLLPGLLAQPALAGDGQTGIERQLKQIGGPGPGAIRAPAPGILVHEGIGYSVRNHVDHNLYSIDLSSGIATRIGATGYSDIEGLSFDANGVLYGYDDTVEELVTLNVWTGAATAVGHSGLAVTEVGLTFDDVGALYLSNEIPHVLYKLNPHTGASTPVGLMSQSVCGLAFQNGVMYGLGGSSTNNLVSINRTNGVVTPIGPLGTVTVTDGGIDFDAHGVLWGLDEGGRLFTINPANGAATMVANIGNGFEGLAISPNHNPDCSGAIPSIDSLWPANHKLVSLEILGVSDEDGDLVTITIDGITQDEPVDGTGDGDACPDGIAGSTAQLRAERDGNGNGRVYVVSFTADDGHGGRCSGSVSVCVPRDQRVPTCENDGQSFNSLGPCSSGNGKGPGGPGVKILTSAGIATTLEYSLTADGEMQLAVYDLMGRRVAVVESGSRSAGTHRATWNSGGLPSGMYFAVLRAGDRVVRTPVMLLK